MSIPKCPLCGGENISRGSSLRFGEYSSNRECIKCGAIYKNLYRLVYDRQEIVIPSKSEVNQNDK